MKRTRARVLAWCQRPGLSGVVRATSAGPGLTVERYGVHGEPSRVAEESRLLAVAASLTAGILRLSAALRPLTAGRGHRPLAITVVAPEERFDEVIAETAPIIESIEFHPQSA